MSIFQDLLLLELCILPQLVQQEIRHVRCFLVWRAWSIWCSHLRLSKLVWSRRYWHSSVLGLIVLTIFKLIRLQHSLESQVLQVLRVKYCRRHWKNWVRKFFLGRLEKRHELRNVIFFNFILLVLNFKVRVNNRIRFLNYWVNLNLLTCMPVMGVSLIVDIIFVRD